jgi:hypothetical protein
MDITIKMALQKLVAQETNVQAEDKEELIEHRGIHTVTQLEME